MANGYFESDFNLSYHYPGKAGYYWGFKWSSTKKSPGVSTVNWTLYRRHASEDGKSATTYIYLKINGTQTNIDLNSATSLAFPKYDAGNGLA